MKKYNFYSALALANDLYGVDLDEDTFETIGMVAFNKIGNKDTRMYHTVLKVQKGPEGWYVYKPCNLIYIEAVTTKFLDVKELTTTHEWYAGGAYSIESDIELRRRNSHRLYTHNEFALFEDLGDKLVFNKNYGEVHLYYLGHYMDENELPYLTEREMQAIAMYCAYSEDFKKARLTRDASTFQLAQAEKQEWIKLSQLARIPEHINQNVIDEVLDVQTSFNRKLYGLSAHIAH